MTESVTSQQQIDALKQKLEVAVNSRSGIENDLKHQGQLLTQFIGKLSQTAKGLDVSLDNKLATLRHAIAKSMPLSELENQIQAITTLLQQYSSQNERKLVEVHKHLLDYGQSLQKSNNVPDNTRRELRKLLTENEERKDTLVLYVPILIELLHFFDQVLRSKSTAPANGLLNAIKAPVKQEKVNDDSGAKQYIEEFSNILSQLVVSSTQRQRINTIKSQLPTIETKDQLFEHFFSVFDVIVTDLKQERSTAKKFLSTLSETLTTVQTAVNSTLTHSNTAFDKHDKLNEILQSQVNEMCEQLKDAASLTSVKNDINEKLKVIVSTIDKKSAIENEQKAIINQQMQEMADKVAHLEKQSQVFEKKIKEQQIQSMQDALTKLPNRAAFDDYATKKIVKFHREAFDLAFVVLDLDDFKRINDTYGHTAGDKTLQVIAKTLQKHMDEKTFIARYGGEEFVMVCSHASKQAVLNKLNLIRKQVALLPFKFKNNKVSITLSMGAYHVKKEDNIHSAFEKADTALYQAKAAGKNCVTYL